MFLDHIATRLVVVGNALRKAQGSVVSDRIGMRFDSLIVL